MLKLMSLIFTHENKIIVDNIRNILQMGGVETEIKNEYCAGAVGELSAIDTWPELWLVDPAQDVRAKNILAKLESDASGEIWICKSCGEENEPSFEICWSCEE
jgi:hypothetical protein